MHSGSHASTFETERIRLCKTTELSPQDARTIAHVEEFGLSIITVDDGTQPQNWTCSIGNYDVSGKPEVIVTGLKAGVAQYLLNEAARRMREGADLTVGRHRELLGEVECELRPVDEKWVKHLMGRATWYYAGERYPVLQAVYRDLQNRFPGDPGFDERFAQPLMQPDAPMTQVEQDFWASANPKIEAQEWPFREKRNTLVYLSKPVHQGVESIVFVSHHHNGDWQFLGESMADAGGPVVVCFHHPIDSDASLKELSALPIGWYAERTTPDTPWVLHELPHEESPGAELA